MTKFLSDGTKEVRRISHCVRCDRKTVHVSVVGCGGQRFAPGFECNDCGTVKPRRVAAVGVPK